MLPVLMDHEHIKPVVLRNLSSSVRHEHLDSVTPQLVMHSRVSHIANTIDGEVRRTLAKKDGFDTNALVASFWQGIFRTKVDLTKVVNDPRDGEHV